MTLRTYTKNGKILIHAPAKGATCWGGQVEPTEEKISIHAPAKGATAARPRKAADRCYFNPRSREGSDP